MRSQVYFPILRAKGGEFSAMTALSERTKSLIVPLFDLPNTKNPTAFSFLQANVARSLATTWGTANELFLDISRYDPDAETSDGVPYVTRLFESAQQVGLKGIPVVAPLQERYGKAGVYFRSIAAIALRDGRGVAIRLPYEDLKNVDKLNLVVDEIQQALSLGDKDSDVILDFGPLDHLPVGRKQVTVLVQQVISAVSTAFAHRNFRVLVVSGSSIPRSNGKVPDGEPVRIPNAEFQAWSQSMNSVPLRKVRLGDFGARYALQTDKGAGANPPARIHLSTPDNHLLYVGDGPTYRELAEKANLTPEFASQGGTWGKYAVRDAGRGRDGAGNAEAWVARDTHMHVETIAHCTVERLKEVGIKVPSAESRSVEFDQAELYF